MANRIQLRRDTAVNWSESNPTLASGEIGIDLTNKKIKIGDGITLWNNLDYWDDQEPTGFDGTYDSLTDKPTLFSGSYNDLSNKPTLFSGSYNDLSNKPTIPSDVADLTDNTNLLSGGSTNQLVNGSYDVTLDASGNTTFPGQGTYTRQNNSYTRTFNGTNISGSPTVIWTGTNDSITSVKMTIQIEGNETGDATGWHTQICEAVIAERYWGNVGTLDPTMSVYGVVHTSVAPLATFTVQRNATTHLIEVVATPSGTATGTLYPKIHSVELGTRD